MTRNFGEATLSATYHSPADEFAALLALASRHATNPSRHRAISTLISTFVQSRPDEAAPENALEILNSLPQDLNGDRDEAIELVQMRIRKKAVMN